MPTTICIQRAPSEMGAFEPPELLKAGLWDSVDPTIIPSRGIATL